MSTLQINTSNAKAGLVLYKYKPSIQTASLVSDMEFGKVERTLSKKLNSTVVVCRRKVNPDMCIDLTRTVIKSHYDQRLVSLSRFLRQSATLAPPANQARCTLHASSARNPHIVHSHVGVKPTKRPTPTLTLLYIGVSGLALQDRRSSENPSIWTDR